MFVCPWNAYLKSATEICMTCIGTHNNHTDSMKLNTESPETRSQCIFRSELWNFVVRRLLLTDLTTSSYLNSLKHFNIILPFMHILSRGIIPSRLTIKNLVVISWLSDACYMSCKKRNTVEEKMWYDKHWSAVGSLFCEQTRSLPRLVGIVRGFKLEIDAILWNNANKTNFIGNYDFSLKCWHRSEVDLRAVAGSDCGGEIHWCPGLKLQFHTWVRSHFKGHDLTLFCKYFNLRCCIVNTDVRTPHYVRHTIHNFMNYQGTSFISHLCI